MEIKKTSKAAIIYVDLTFIVIQYKTLLKLLISAQKKINYSLYKLKAEMSRNDLSQF